jgi:hypothetical protein
MNDRERGLGGRSARDPRAHARDAVRASLRVLDGMQLGAADLTRRGTHPTFGAVTMGQLVAKRYDADVGPWKEFLGVLKRG